eukprot:1126260-Rhodomonas_salina.1
MIGKGEREGGRRREGRRGEKGGKGEERGDRRDEEEEGWREEGERESRIHTRLQSLRESRTTLQRLLSLVLSSPKLLRRLAVGPEVGMAGDDCCMR